MKTWNKRLAGMTAVLLSVVFSVAAVPSLLLSAAGGPPRLVDGAELLSDGEEADLTGRLDEISERQQVDLAVVTVNSLDGKSPRAYADDYFDQNGYGFGEERDGILLLISMEERDWYISTSGYGITAVTDAGREYISELFVSDLSAGDYAAAFTGFADLCDDFITQARTGEPYDEGHLPEDPAAYFAGSFVISFGIAFLIALIATAAMRGKLKTVHSRSGADEYRKQGSMKLTKKNDLYLYRHTDRRKREQNTGSGKAGRSGSSGGSRTHTSSSGRTHGGGGGKF